MPISNLILVCQCLLFVLRLCRLCPGLLLPCLSLTPCRPTKEKARDAGLRHRGRLGKPGQA
ncbi:hypothetical protein B0920_21995 [Massilia sp. KIM]|uniref:hypothetical protein n=1 Tax=Massilia sp. KIM TaxID=1955422 RepID=UPI00098F9ACE|nr:hypothetical protein [Massilia sp. KIM]OON59946.1 hypothetical protein B0920_21995 [Massilia sp. KIM]